MKNKIICILFLVLVFGFTAFDFLTPDRDFSEWENRQLAQLPNITADSVFSGRFGSEYETYMTDQFPLRDAFVKAKFLTDSALGRTDSGGVYVGAEALYSKQLDFDYSELDKNIKAIDTFALNNGIDTKVIVVPSSTYIYSDRLPKFAKVLNEGELFGYIAQKLENADFVNIVDKITESRENYIYFRTDHHWTYEGALIAYNAYLHSIGRQEVGNEALTLTAVSDDFQGTLLSKSGALGIESDTLYRIERGRVVGVKTHNGLTVTEYNSIYFDDYLSKKDKYSYYLGSNQPLVSVETESEGGRLIVFKDSYAHITAPLMTGDWSQIVFVDLRYVTQKIDALLSDTLGLALSDFDNALFLYSTETFSTQSNMIWIN